MRKRSLTFGSATQPLSLIWENLLPVFMLRMKAKRSAHTGIEYGMSKGRHLPLLCFSPLVVWHLSVLDSIRDLLSWSRWRLENVIVMSLHTSGNDCALLCWRLRWQQSVVTVDLWCVTVEKRTWARSPSTSFHNLQCEGCLHVAGWMWTVGLEAFYGCVTLLAVDMVWCSHFMKCNPATSAEKGWNKYVSFSFISIVTGGTLEDLEYIMIIIFTCL